MNKHSDTHNLIQNMKITFFQNQLLLNLRVKKTLTKYAGDKIPLSKNPNSYLESWQVYNLFIFET